jgi:hypothetical protein
MYDFGNCSNLKNVKTLKISRFRKFYFLEKSLDLKNIQISKVFKSKKCLDTFKNRENMNKIQKTC